MEVQKTTKPVDPLNENDEAFKINQAVSQQEITH